MDLSSHFSKLHVSDEDYEFSDSRDRLSELPDSLILEILSLLKVRDNVRTSILSKRWKDVWVTVPCLDFTDENRDHIFKALAQWKGTKILKFSPCRVYDASATDIDSLLLFAIDKQVEDLDIDLVHTYIHEYWVPQRLYSCSSLTRLSLHCCNLKIDENVLWNQLKSLELDRCVGPSWSIGHSLNQIISASPRLENLKLSSYEFIGNIDIRSSSLKKLKIKMSYGSSKWPLLRIWAPNLLALKIKGGVRVTSSWDVPSLTDAVLKAKIVEEIIHFPEAFNRVFLSLRHVEKITLSDWCIQFLLYMKRKKDMVVHFSNAKFLQLYYGDVYEPRKIFHILEMFPQLVRLIVEQDKLRVRYPAFAGYSNPYPIPYEVQCTFPSPSLLQLKKVEITWFLEPGERLILQVVKIILLNAHVLDKMVFGVICYDDVTYLDEFLMAKEKVMSMRRSSPTSESGYTFESDTTPSLLHLETVDISWSLSYPSIFPIDDRNFVGKRSRA